ncbi:hypothetical protein X777_07334 [Ooceraea biroi]|uniref:Uncharacterized protein n=1 Tax=Ooceraea biroi TaxID=2015173 RepID=A0A026X105_OOCBI|nr:hypothetical protein X777_07334 [Ooceraea biroi]
MKLRRRLIWKLSKVRSVPRVPLKPLIPRLKLGRPTMKFKTKERKRGSQFKIMDHNPNTRTDNLLLAVT